MRRIVIKQARPGMLLARAIPHPRRADQPLLRAASSLTIANLATLHEHGIYDLWILHPGLEFFDDLITDSLTRHQRRLCESLCESFQRYAAANPAVPLHRSRPAVEQLVGTLLGNPALQPILSALASVDENLLRHSTDACILGLLLGLRLDDYIVEQRRRLASKHARDLVNLGLGCLLHDIGELQLPEAHRESRHPLILDPLAGNDWMQHTELGFAALRGHIEPSAASIVLHHHQHFNGSGSAFSDHRQINLAGPAIHVFSRIAMVADTFLHILHSAPGGIAHPVVHALWQIQQQPYLQWCDPTVLQALLTLVQPFTPGMVVTLSDNRQAIVTRTEDQPVCYPEVQILRSPGELDDPTHHPETITLARTRLHIEQVDGSPVEPYLYGPHNTPTPIPTPPALQRLSA